MVQDSVLNPQMKMSDLWRNYIYAFLLLTLLCILLSFLLPIFHPTLNSSFLFHSYDNFFPFSKCCCFVFPSFSQFSSYCSILPSLWELNFSYWFLLSWVAVSPMSLLSWPHRFVLLLSTFPSNSSIFVWVYIYIIRKSCLHCLENLLLQPSILLNSFLLSYYKHWEIIFMRMNY